MQKEKQRGVQENRANHVRVRVFDNIVIAISH
jgi:hypothetical protein